MFTTEHAICQQQVTNTDFQYGTIPQNDQSANIVALDHIEECFVLTEIDIYSGYELPSLHAKLLLKLPYVDLQNNLSIVMVFYTALLLTKKLIS